MVPHCVSRRHTYKARMHAHALAPRCERPPFAAEVGRCSRIRARMAEPSDLQQDGYLGSTAPAYKPGDPHNSSPELATASRLSMEGATGRMTASWGRAVHLREMIIFDGAP